MVFSYKRSARSGPLATKATTGMARILQEAEGPSDSATTISPFLRGKAFISIRAIYTMAMLVITRG